MFPRQSHVLPTLAAKIAKQPRYYSFKGLHVKKKTEHKCSVFKVLAATYSRRGYTTTTIGNAAFDGRVRKGIGSDHSFMATKKL